MSELRIIGRAERLDFPGLNMTKIPARIDTGAKTSAIWASGIFENHGILECVLLGPGSPYYTGEKLQFRNYTQRVITSSLGDTETRYIIKLVVAIKDKKIRASFSLANRSKQTYPVLVGRNILRGKFLVDVKAGQPLIEYEHRRSAELQKNLKEQQS